MTDRELASPRDHPQLMRVVTAELRRRILELELPPGAHLVESRLADELGVSRNPVREAIRVLSTEGFVEISPRRGAFVARCSAEDAEHMFDVRIALEPVAAGLAAGRVDAVGVAALQTSIAQARSAMDQGELDRLSELNTQFHSLVMEMSGNPYLESVGVATIKRSQWIYRQNANRRAPHSWAEHAALLQAIVDGDSELARAEGHRHVLAARRAFRASETASDTELVDSV